MITDVRIEEQDGMWRVFVRHDTGRTTMMAFTNKESALSAYDRAEERYRAEEREYGHAG